MREGTIVDATLIATPPSAKNRDGKRDPEMHQSKKGKNWLFGMKAHIGVDAKSGLAHTLVTTAGNVSEVTQTRKLLHGDETIVFGDAGCQGADRRPENSGKVVLWHIAMKRSVCKAMKKNALGRMKEKLERAKASVRAKVEHPFHVLKNLFRHRRTRYRGLAKNAAQLHALFAFANLLLAGRTFGTAHARTPSCVENQAPRLAKTAVAALGKFGNQSISAIAMRDAGLHTSNWSETYLFSASLALVPDSTGPSPEVVGPIAAYDVSTLRD